MFTATQKIILMQGKTIQGLREMLTKNIYADQSKYPQPSHNFSNVPPLRNNNCFLYSYPITKQNFKKQWLVNELGPREGMSLGFQVAG